MKRYYFRLQATWIGLGFAALLSGAAAPLVGHIETRGEVAAWWDTGTRASALLCGWLVVFALAWLRRWTDLGRLILAIAIAGFAVWLLGVLSPDRFELFPMSMSGHIPTALPMLLFPAFPLLVFPFAFGDVANGIVPEDVEPNYRGEVFFHFLAWGWTAVALLQEAYLTNGRDVMPMAATGLAVCAVCLVLAWAFDGRAGLLRGEDSLDTRLYLKLDKDPRLKPDPLPAPPAPPAAAAKPAPVIDFGPRLYFGLLGLWLVVTTPFAAAAASRALALFDLIESGRLAWLYLTIACAGAAVHASLLLYGMAWIRGVRARLGVFMLIGGGGIFLLPIFAILFWPSSQGSDRLPVLWKVVGASLPVLLAPIYVMMGATRSDFERKVVRLFPHRPASDYPAILAIAVLAQMWLTIELAPPTGQTALLWAVRVAAAASILTATWALEARLAVLRGERSWLARLYLDRFPKPARPLDAAGPATATAQRSPPQKDAKGLWMEARKRMSVDQLAAADRASLAWIAGMLWAAGSLVKTATGALNVAPFGPRALVPALLGLQVAIAVGLGLRSRALAGLAILTILFDVWLVRRGDAALVPVGAATIAMEAFAVVLSARAGTAYRSLRDTPHFRLVWAEPDRTAMLVRLLVGFAAFNLRLFGIKSGMLGRGPQLVCTVSARALRSTTGRRISASPFSIRFLNSSSGKQAVAKAG